MVDYSISSLYKDFLYLPESSVCDDPGKYKKKNYITNCVTNRSINVYFIFISIKKLHKA